MDVQDRGARVEAVHRYLGLFLPGDGKPLFGRAIPRHPHRPIGRRRDHQRGLILGQQRVVGEIHCRSPSLTSTLRCRRSLPGPTPRRCEACGHHGPSLWTSKTIAPIETQVNDADMTPTAAQDVPGLASSQVSARRRTSGTRRRGPRPERREWARPGPSQMRISGRARTGRFGVSNGNKQTFIHGDHRRQPTWLKEPPRIDYFARTASSRTICFCFLQRGRCRLLLARRFEYRRLSVFPSVSFVTAKVRSGLLTAMAGVAPVPMDNHFLEDKMNSRTA